MIAVINYNMGNVASVVNALKFLGEEVLLTGKREEIARASRIVLPGVGSFRAAMEEINKRGLKEILYAEVISKKKPYLGICLGLQILAQKGYEHGETDGLGFIEGEVIKIKTRERLPHIGWNEVAVNPSRSLLFTGTEKNMFYFVHSYCLSTPEDVVSSRCDYGGSFVSSIQKENIFATQFHPEKSQEEGLLLLKNFLCYKND